MEMRRFLFATAFWLPFLMFTGLCQAQKISYCMELKENKTFFSFSYIAGEQHDSVFIWHYDIFSRTLQLNVCDAEMRLLDRLSLKIERLDDFYSLHFFRKNKCGQILLQYNSKNRILSQLYFFDPETNAIRASKFLDNSVFLSQTIIKYSDNGDYTGTIQPYATAADSTLIRYVLYDDKAKPVKDIQFILPHKYDAFDFGASLIDNSGNLIFYTTAFKDTSVSGQSITLYEANLEKDSLLIKDFFKSGIYSNITIQQNKISKLINVSGFLLNASLDNTVSQISKLNYFSLQLDKDLNNTGEMTLFSPDKIVDSLYPNDTRINSINLVLNKDSGYNIQISGLTHHNIQYREGYTGRMYMPSSDLALDKSNQPENSPRLPLAPNVPNVYRYLLSGSGNSYFTSYNSPASDYRNTITATATGNNFFVLTSIDQKGRVSITGLEDSMQTSSLPQEEYIMNTEKVVYYLFSRKIKRGKQLVFDMIFANGKPAQIKPLYANAKFDLLISEAIQISAHSLLVPFYKVSGLSFAKIDFE